MTTELFAGASSVAAVRFAHGSGRGTLNDTFGEAVSGQPLKSAVTNAEIAPGGTSAVRVIAPSVVPTSCGAVPLASIQTR